MIVDRITSFPPPQDPPPLTAGEDFAPRAPSFQEHLVREKPALKAPGEALSERTEDPRGNARVDQGDAKIERKNRKNPPPRDPDQPVGKKRGKTPPHLVGEKGKVGGPPAKDSEGPGDLGRIEGKKKIPIEFLPDVQTLEDSPEGGKESLGGAVISGEASRAGEGGGLPPLNFPGKNPDEEEQRPSPRRLEEGGAGPTEGRTKRVRIALRDDPGEGIELTISDRRKYRGSRTTSLQREVPRETETFSRIKPAGNSSLEGKLAPPSETEGGNLRVMELGPDSPRGEGRAQEVEGRSSPAPLGEILKEKGIAQLVKQTGILLKDDNRGEIKILLKPETLGKVRIRLNLEDNRIAGRILVENNNVKEAFGQNLVELQRSLRESGFEAVHLEVFVEGRQPRSDRDPDRRPLRHQRRIVEALEESLPRVISSGEEASLVDLIA